MASTRSWLWSSLSSSNFMNLAALLLSSSKLATDCMQRLSANGPGCKAVSMVHGHVRANVLDAHYHLPEHIDEGPQWLSLLLVNANQSDRGQVVQLASGKLRFKLGHRHRKAIDGVGRELCEPTLGSSLQWCRKHSAQGRILWGI